MTNKSRKLPLADWQQEDSARLKAIFQQKKGALRLTQEKIANELGDGVTQGAVSHFLNGRTALSMKAAAVFARMLQVPVSAFSPTLAGQIESISGSLAPSSDSEIVELGNKDAANSPFPGGEEALHSLDDRYAFIPQYDAKAAAGLGSENPHVEIRSTLAFKREWLRVKGVNPKNLIVIYADGQSMWPTISDRDVLLVDRSQLDPIDGQVFVLAHGEKAIVKRLIQCPIGSWIVRSDNDDKVDYPDRVFTRSDANEHRIIGKVIWRGGDL